MDRCTGKDDRAEEDSNGDSSCRGTDEDGDSRPDIANERSRRSLLSASELSAETETWLLRLRSRMKTAAE